MGFIPTLSRFVANFSSRIGTSVVGVAITPNGARAYVTNLTGNTVSVIDTTTNSVSTTIPAGLSTRSLAITPDGARAYVTEIGSNTISVIDMATNSYFER